MKLDELLMCQGIQRWHIVDTSRTQSVAEHSFNVAMIVCKFMEKMGCKNEDIAQNMVMALAHDADEVHEGDVPAIAKKPPILKLSLAGRAIQIADKLEAYWFSHHFVIGPRRRFVMEDTRLRFTRLLEQSKHNERGMWLEVEQEMHCE